MVGDHLYVSRTDESCAQQLVEVAQTEVCAISAVQATRENQLPYYGTVGGRLVGGQQLKEPAQLDGWLRDGSAAYLEALCEWE